MTNHQEVARIACRELSKIDGIQKIWLFGSVARGEERVGSDIDLAAFVDWPRGTHFPQSTCLKLKSVSEDLTRTYGIEVKPSFYFDFEYEKGVLLEGNKGYQDRLEDVGIVMYDSNVAVENCRAF